MATLQRITTEYIDQEDRIRLTGELAQGDTVVLWLTQRLMNRLVAHLTAWLSRQISPASRIPSVQAAHQEIVQGFAQQAARAQLAPEPPVRASSEEAGWRVDSVDIAQGEEAVVLTFKGEGEAQATLTLTAQPLRQWLGIVFEQYQRGEWPTTVWPGWMEVARPQAAPGAMALH
ncbi:hypothetical protein [Thauera sp. AutoDN2]|uniref:hypothetical protein n=1 Tax=Thauera sp. AutoDN2 TaxID=3416051 RepID=UPI003F4BA364